MNNKLKYAVLAAALGLGFVWLALRASSHASASPTHLFLSSAFHIAPDSGNSRADNRDMEQAAVFD